MCPVTGGVLLATSLSLTTAAGALTTGGLVVAALGAAAIGAATAVAVNGVVNVATGQSFFKGAGMSALMGGVTAGIGAGFSNAATNSAIAAGGGVSNIPAGAAARTAAIQSGTTSSGAILQQGYSGVTTGLVDSVANTGLTSISGAQVGATVGGQLASGTGIAFSSAGSSALRSITPEFAKYTPQLAQAFNPAESKITGSGGTQAAGVLAASIQAVKKRRERQTLTGDVGLGTFTNTGLQFA